MLVAQLAPSNLESRAQRLLRRFVQPQAFVDAADRSQQPRLHFGLADKSGVDLGGALIEDLACRDTVATRLTGIGNIEEVDDELERSGGELRLTVGAVTLVGDAFGLNRHRSRHRDERREQQRRERDAKAMPAHKLARSIHRARWAGQNRFMFEVAL